MARILELIDQLRQENISLKAQLNGQEKLPDVDEN